MPKEVLIIDNASNDGSLEKLMAMYKNTSIIRFIANRENFGFAKGVNQGIRAYLDQPEIDHIVLLNQDTIVDNRFIEACHQTIQNYPEVGVVGPRIFYHDKPQKVWHGPLFFSYAKCGVINPEKNKFQQCLEEKDRQSDFLTGCALFIKKEIFIKTGLFDEDYFFYYEDYDYCIRVKKAGYKLWFNPKGKVWHKITDIAKDRTNPYVIYYLAKGYIIFLRKNFSLFFILYGSLLHFFVYTPYRLIQILLGSRSLKSIASWFKGTIDGFTMRIRRSK